MDSDRELRLSIMATMAQDESRKTSNQVVWGQTRQMEKGVVFGRSLLGYEVYVGDLVQKKTYTPDYLTREKRTNKGRKRGKGERGPFQNASGASDGVPGPAYGAASA